MQCLLLQCLQIKEENTEHNRNEDSSLKDKNAYFVCTEQGLLLKLKLDM